MKTGNDSEGGGPLVTLKPSALNCRGTVVMITMDRISDDEARE